MFQSSFDAGDCRGLDAEAGPEGAGDGAGAAAEAEVEACRQSEGVKKEDGVVVGVLD